MDFLVIFLCSLVGVIILFMIIMYICFRICFVKSNRKIKFNIPDEYKDIVINGTNHLKECEKEEVTIKSFDGINLRGYFIKGTKPITEIFFHGYRSSIYDFAGAFDFYKNSGINMLFVDQRAHGNSDGKYITFGVNESRDVASWVKFIKEKVGGTIILGGISMGASTIMMAADKLKPGDVSGIIADCGYSSPREIISHVMRKDYHIPKFIIPFFINIFELYAKIFGKFSFKNDSVPSSLKNADCPIIITHGDVDTFVPSYMSEINAKANENVKLVIVKGAKHGFAYVVDPNACFGIIKSTFPEIFE